MDGKPESMMTRFLNVCTVGMKSIAKCTNDPDINQRGYSTLLYTMVSIMPIKIKRQ